MIGSKKKTKKANVFKDIADNFEQLTSNPERFLKFVFTNQPRTCFCI